MFPRTSAIAFPVARQRCKTLARRPSVLRDDSVNPIKAVEHVTASGPESNSKGFLCGQMQSFCCDLMKTLCSREDNRSTSVDWIDSTNRFSAGCE
jgi:hypothetical protein